jgi:hypothetical protein
MHRQQGGFISLHLFFQNKESRLKRNMGVNGKIRFPIWTTNTFSRISQFRNNGRGVR